MSAQSVAPRSRKPQQAEPDDIVLARAIEFSNWARANIRLVVGGAAAVLVIVVALLWWRADRAAREERAAMEFMQLEQTVVSGNTALAARELDQYIARFGGTDYADEARLVLARLHLQGGQPAAALSALEPLASDPGSSPLATQAAVLYASAQEAAGQRDAAIESYLAVAREAELDYQRAEAFASAARLRTLSGDHAGAAELYARAAELAKEETPDRTIYEMRRAEAEARARSAS
jgi:predicted negative regulator of RcsB-dependent stress response